MKDEFDMKKRTKFAILASIAVVVIVAGVATGIYLNGLINDQGGNFKPSEIIGIGTPDPNATAAPVTPDFTLEPGATPTPSPEPTIDPFITLQEQADTTMMNNIVNVLVIGIDGDEYRESSDWNGKKEWHSDVMLLLAVNFDQMRVDMISLPRDTYANIPDVKGIYKLNASLNCGGGYVNKDGSINYAAFEKVCQSAEWMLGGISVDYYYAVNMDTVKGLVDAIGGVDYEIEGHFDIAQRFYEPGMQHMDGQAVLDYMRVRKKSKYTKVWGISTSDANRVIRQKNMLTALFKKMKSENLITSIPSLVQAFEGRLFTNCTLSQTAALATFAYQLDPNNIGMHSMGGNSATLLGWNFVFTNQAERVKLIEQVYGVKVSQYPQYTKQYAQYRWGTMLEEQYLEVCEPLTKYVEALIAADDLLPEFTPEPSPSETPAPIITPEPTVDSTEVPTTTAPNPKVYYSETTPLIRQYTAEQRKQWEDYLKCLDELEDASESAEKEAKKARNGSSNSLSSAANKYLEKLAELQDKAIALAKTFKYEKKYFDAVCYPTDVYKKNSVWSLNYWDDKKINEVNVDFN